MLRHKATRRMASATLATLIGVAGLSLVGNDLAGAATTPAGVTDGPVAGVISNYTNASISGPTGITVGHDGALWFTNLNFSSVGRITTAGSVSSYANPSSSITWDITAGSDGALWFSNLGNNLIGRITTAGATTY
jgi:streptogramin lyase